MKYLTTIGLETHVQLKTATKMFCGCSLKFGEEPNTNVCPVCLGYPGALPVANREAIKLTVMSGLMLGCTINKHSTFDRKNYFYPDMAKDYQISQNTHPLCLGGGVTIQTPAGPKVIRINHIHLEEDAAKINHYGQFSGVDFNRGGTPLMEIVSEPDLSSPDEAMAYLQALKQILVYAGVSDCNLEEGNMRSDVNVSIRPEGQVKLGTKVEIKNMNTFKGIYAAANYEIARQTYAVTHGQSLVQETRRWEPDMNETQSMRSKENAHDYRYLPEPDLVPIALGEAQIEAWRNELPELPSEKKNRFMTQYALPEYDAGVLTASLPLSGYFEDVVKFLGKYEDYKDSSDASRICKKAANWVMGDVLCLLSATGKSIEEFATKVPPQILSNLIMQVDKGNYNVQAVRKKLRDLLEGVPTGLTEEKQTQEIETERSTAEPLRYSSGMEQLNDTNVIGRFVAEVLAAHPKVVEDYKGGKPAALQFLIGQVMKLSKGNANPKLARDLIAKALE
jgi:aspartyl-tRNA(Asn)/glutamyl-tRNA(Gln) amidotransferase subunit B